MPRQCQTSLTCLNTVPPQAEAEASQLRARVQFLTQENEDLAQRNEEVLTRSEDVFLISYLICEYLVFRFDRVNSEKEKLKGDIEELRTISQKLQTDVGKVSEEKTLLSAIVKNTQGTY